MTPTLLARGLCVRFPARRRIPRGRYRLRRPAPTGEAAWVEALRDVSFEIPAGGACAVIGSNGAGKSTLARVALGLVAPARGRIWIAGRQVLSPGEAGAAAGYVPGEDRSLAGRLTVRENLRFHASLLGVPDAASRVESLAETFDLGPLLARPAADLSSGQRQRAALARAMLHRPDVLVLDEPTRSLDADTTRRVWDLLRRLRAEGTTILLCTHRLDEAEALCDRVLLLQEGRVAAHGAMPLFLPLDRTIPEISSGAAPPRDSEEGTTEPSDPAPTALRAAPVRGGTPANAVRAGLVRAAQEDRSYRLSFLLQGGGVLLEVATLFFLARLVDPARLFPLAEYGGGYFAFVLVWLLFQEWQSGALFTAVAEIRTGQMTGTLEASFLSTRHPLALLGGACAWALAKASVASILLGIAGAWTLGLTPPGIVAGVCAAAAALLGTLAALGVGIAGAGTALAFQRGNPALALYGAASMLLAGGAYPTEVLPAPLRIAGEALPLTATLRVLRATLLTGRADIGVLRDLTILTLFAALLVGGGVLIFRAGVREALRRGSLGRY